MDVSKRLSCIWLMNLTEKHKSFAEEIGLQVKLVSPANVEVKLDKLKFSKTQ